MEEEQKLRELKKNEGFEGNGIIYILFTCWKGRHEPDKTILVIMLVAREMFNANSLYSHVRTYFSHQFYCIVIIFYNQLLSP
jgi:hypothetical protein